MFRPEIAVRELSDSRRAVAGWALGAMLLGGLLVSLFPSVREGGAQLNELMESYPDAMKSFLGVEGVDYTTGVGYLRTEVFGFTGPLLLVVLAVGRGASSLAGERSRGTLDLVLATPVARRRVALEKAAALLAEVLVVSLALSAAVFAVGSSVGLGVGWVALLRATVFTGLLAGVFGVAALAVGGLTGRRGIAVGCATALAFATYLLDSLAGIVEALEPWRRLSPFSYYRDGDPLGAGFAAADAAVLVALVLVAAAATVLGFRRRDIHD